MRRRGLDRSVAIDYYLKQPAQKVTMAFLDAQGKTIRTFTGTPADAERKPPSPGDDDGPRPSAGAASGGQRGLAPADVGHALPWRDRLSGARHVGRQLSRARWRPLAPTRYA
jgi:hypothetical protein